MREVGIVAFILTLVWANTEIVTRNCNTKFPTPNCETWIKAKDKVVKTAWDDG